MFSKLFGRSKKTSVPDIDLSLGYNMVSEFKNYLVAKQYTQFETAYNSIAWDAQTLLNEGIGLDKNYAAVIHDWVQQCPDSYTANLFAGVSKTCLAWIARTAAMGKDVKEDAANQYFELLDSAAQYLLRSDEIKPDDAEVCARIIRVCTGLGIEQETVLSYFNAATALQPNHFMAHMMTINYLNPKWQGSLEAMQDFANQRYTETGSSLLITLKLFAITEEWLYYSMSGENKKHSQFFDDTAVKETIQHLYNSYTEQEDGALLIPYVYNYFAFLFWQTGNKTQARELIKKISGKITVYPWAYIDVESNIQLQSL